MKHTRLKLIFLLPLLMGKPALSQITTSQYDNTRTAAHTLRKSPDAAGTSLPSTSATWRVQGGRAVFAQPLYIPNVEIPDRVRTTWLYVATEHDSVYAFDADHPGSLPYGKSAFSTKRRGTIPLSEDWCNARLFGRKSASPLRQSLTSRPERFTCWPALQSATRSVTRIFSLLHALAITTGVENSEAPN